MEDKVENLAESSDRQGTGQAVGYGEEQLQKVTHSNPQAQDTRKERE